jgi:hypothetical protein
MQVAGVLSLLLALLMASTASAAARHVLTQGAASIRLGIYRHYKGQLYRVHGVCRHTETEEDLVYYQSLYGQHEFWARPLGMFFETVEFGDGREACPRFVFVQDAS